jgi:hypothetical protein
MHPAPCFSYPRREGELHRQSASCYGRCTQIAAYVVALPKSSALGQSTKPQPRNYTLFRLTWAELFGLRHRRGTYSDAAQRRNRTKA